VIARLSDHNTEDCRAFGSILARVGDEWTVLSVVLLGDGPKRFNEIKRMVGGISQRRKRPRVSSRPGGRQARQLRSRVWRWFFRLGGIMWVGALSATNAIVAGTTALVAMSAGAWGRPHY
jgi:hypothetical protein